MSIRRLSGNWKLHRVALRPLLASRYKTTAHETQRAEDFTGGIHQSSKFQTRGIKKASKDAKVNDTKYTLNDLKRRTDAKLLRDFSLNKLSLSTSEKDEFLERTISLTNKKRTLLPKSNLRPKTIKGLVTTTEEVQQSRKLDSSNIPRLQHNLDRALFSPGVHFLQDHRSRVYNFTPSLKNIIKYSDFNFNAIETFVNVSKDETLLQAANEQNKQFYSSTSSMTSALIQFYYLLNNYDPASTDRFAFPKLAGANEKLPASLLIQPKGKNPTTGQTVYAVESDKSADTEILLSAMGHCLEALLTTDPEQFELYKVTSSQLPEPTQNIYNYATYGDFLMRSQLDCYDLRLPGNGTFDLKTRAVCAIRYDSGNPDLENNQYQIWKLKGQFESFEREYTDLIRTGALLKYSFQARIGQMDGIYVAYHNINSFFGFQYLPLEEIDKVFYTYDKGQPRYINAKTLDDLQDDLPSHVADTQFKMSLEVWTKLLKTIISDLQEEHGETAFRLVLKSQRRPGTHEHRLKAMAVPLTSDQVSTLQQFPKSFKTSFREDIDSQERYANLKAHSSKLNTFNEQTVERGVKLYSIDVKHLFGRRQTPVKDPHPYPHSKTQPWSLAYSIKRLEKGPTQYLKLLRVATDLLIQHEPLPIPEPEESSSEINITDPTNMMKAYLAIGAARANKWQSQDGDPVIYKPK